MKFSILSWNINGLRSNKTDLKELLDSLKSDIICFQETKITRDMLQEPLAIVDGYSSYFSFSRKRSGYSGVATYCKDSVAPTHCQEGLGGGLTNYLFNEGGSTEKLSCYWSPTDLKELDQEGRTIITQHLFQNEDGNSETLTIINVYCPRVDPEKPERGIYKMKFLELLRQRADAIRKTGSHVIVLGDINVAHRRIDHCDPDDSEKRGERNFEDHPGRKFLDSFVLNTNSTNGDAAENSNISEDLSFTMHDEYILPDLENYAAPNYTNFQVIDTFRYFNPTCDKSFTCWNTFTNARATNYGTRIDYIFCNKEFIKYLENSTVEQDIYGSDHCPIKITLNVDLKSSTKLPELCTKFFPEIKGKQCKISNFFTNKSEGTNNNNNKRKIDENIKSITKTKQSKLSNFFAVNKQDKNEKFCATKEFLKSKSQDNETAVNSKKPVSGGAWGFLMKPPKPAPDCPGHGEPCCLRTVKKKGPNFNKQFYACARGVGKEGDPEARCNFFKWY